jgi:dihydrolipoamide dehydrogenase
MERTYDALVIGAGSAGENVAARIARRGFCVAIIESALVGGECSYYACIPSKAMLRPVHALSAVRAVEGSRQAVDGTLAVDGVFARRDAFVSRWQDDDQVPWLSKRGIDLVRGAARLSGPKQVTVTDEGGVRTLRARTAVAICTGSEPSIPYVPGLLEARPWTSRDATAARAVPRRLVIIGGGPVACEMATLWRALGSDVTIIMRESQPLAKMEPFVGEALLRTLAAQGVRFLSETGVRAVLRDASDTVHVELSEGTVLHADEILVATGRKPRTSELGLENHGIPPGSWLEVDNHMRVCAVSEGWLYAAGDVTNQALLTHMGKYGARVCGDVIAAVAQAGLACLERDAWSSVTANAYPRAVPQVLFTDPEIASVGLTEHQASMQGLTLRVADVDLADIAGAQLYADGYRGRARLIVDRERRVVVGATFIGRDIGELLHAATIAIVGEVPLDRLWHAVPAYPTVSEAWLRLLESIGC